jgi:hypothetical protein
VLSDRQRPQPSDKMKGELRKAFGVVSSHNGIDHTRTGLLTSPCRRPEYFKATRKSWQQERIQRLARICRCIDQGRARGKRIHKLLVLFTWRWRNRCYTVDPSRKIQFGYATLRRAYYKWKHSGGDPQALKLAYWSQSRRAPLAWTDTHKLVLASLQRDVRSLRAAYRALKDPLGRTQDAWRHALPQEIRKTLVELHRTRRHAAIIERELERKLRLTVPANDPQEGRM